MKIVQLIRSCLLVLGVLFAVPAMAGDSVVNSYGSLPPWLKAGWSNNPLWADGQVEVDIYDATTTLHGKPRSYTMTAYFSATQAATKTGAEFTSESLAPVSAMKMTIVSEEISTGDDAYDLAATVIVDRNNPYHVLNTIATSHDWNGVTAKHFWGGNPPLLQAWSTFGAGHLQRPLPQDVVPMEAVPFFLRAMDYTTTASFKCLPTLMAHRLPWSGVVTEPEFFSLHAQSDGSETTTTAAGTFDCFRIKVSVPEGPVPMVLWYEKAFPNRLVAKTTASGKQFILRKSERRKIPAGDPH